MPKPLRRVSPAAERGVLAVAERESRTFIVQLDRVVAAGLHALGEDVPEELRPLLPAKPTRKRAAAAAR